MACSQFVHICRRSKGNFSLSAAPIITDFFRLHKQIISHYCDHYLRSHHPRIPGTPGRKLTAYPRQHPKQAHTQKTHALHTDPPCMQNVRFLIQSLLLVLQILFQLTKEPFLLPFLRRNSLHRVIKPLQSLLLLLRKLLRNCNNKRYIMIAADVLVS